ncbi:MAG: Zinc ribbon domain protein [candidate division BRC1 bacterium ADurb.BinA364]|nr:MAG: Zinc ribbon domain protein [candidate division BRC1 bacterium ADurb.BinA364]
MPVYEYACSHCRMIYQFLARSIHTTNRPKCPKCGAEDLKRLISRVNIITGSKTKASSKKESEGPGEPPGAPPEMPGEMDMDGEGPGGGFPDDPFAGMSPERQAYAEREMMRLMEDAESMNDEDPRQMGHLMERMMKIVGQDDNKEMREAIRRLKAGEDPDKIEEDLGDVLGMGAGDDEEGGGGGGYGGYGYDDNLYGM